MKVRFKRFSSIVEKEKLYFFAGGYEYGSSDFNNWLKDKTGGKVTDAFKGVRDKTNGKDAGWLKEMKSQFEKDWIAKNDAINAKKLEISGQNLDAATQARKPLDFETWKKNNPKQVTTNKATRDAYRQYVRNNNGTFQVQKFDKNGNLYNETVTTTGNSTKDLTRGRNRYVGRTSFKQGNGSFGAVGSSMAKKPGWFVRNTNSLVAGTVLGGLAIGSLLGLHRNNND